MRTIEFRATHVPAFLTKLWKLVTDPGSDDLISWSVGGTSFIIYDEIRFAKDLLPMYFKHNNMASFVRQLNMYGFRKLSCIDQGGMHSIKHEIEFYHQYFIKDQENLLELIKRKIPSNRASDESKIKPEYVKELISSIKSLQGKQQSSEEGMKTLRRENKLLWRQLALMNNRYMKQQTVLQQVLPVFMNMVQSSQRLPLKRRLTLMIHDGESDAKAPRIESPYFVERNERNISPALTPSPGNVSNRGPVITEMESSKMFADNILCASNAAKENDVIVDSPLSSLESSEHTMDSPFTDAETMEPLNILNCGFKNINRMTSPAEMVSSGRILTPPGLLPQEVNMPTVQNHLVNVNPMLQPMSSMSVQNECPAAAGSVNVAPGTSYASPSSSPRSLPAQVHCSEAITMMNMMNEASNQLPPCPPPPPPPPAPSSVAGDIMSQEQAIANILNWLPNGACESEQNIDSWLGQLIRADNLATGASLPVRVGPNV